MQQHQSRSLGGRPHQLPQVWRRCPLRTTSGQRIRPIVYAEPSEDIKSESGKLFGLIPLRSKGENLDARIESGEFTDEGSTKEKLTRPLRQALAKDPVIGEVLGDFRPMTRLGR